VAQVLATVRARVGRLLARRQLEPADDSAPPDPLRETSPVLAAIVSASVQSPVALGPRASAASAMSRTAVTSPPAARARPSSRASTSTPTSGSHATIVPASNSSVAISSAPRSPRTASASARRPHPRRAQDGCGAMAPRGLGGRLQRLSTPEDDLSRHVRDTNEADE
jgi:hypothetical protein